MKKRDIEKLKCLYKKYEAYGNGKKLRNLRYQKILAAIDFVKEYDKQKKKYGLLHKEMAEILDIKIRKIKYLRSGAINRKRTKFENFRDIEAIKTLKKEKLEKYLKFTKENK